MASRPYFTITKDSFEKNAGYRSTVHALAELIDNAFEAEAKNVAVVLMVDANSRLQKIAVLDDGKGMDGKLLQAAVCEKAGSFMERRHGAGPPSRRKLGKYGVGLPKASISQCNYFSVWSWRKGGPTAALKNEVDIADESWIKKGAEISDSWSDAAPVKWLKAGGLDGAKSGTLVLWEELDGITWARARWGDNSGLVPNLEFAIGRVYRKMISGKEFQVRVVTVDGHFTEVENRVVEANDPLYLTKKANVPRYKAQDGSIWPPDDPLFDDVTHGDYDLAVEVPLSAGQKAHKVKIRWRASAARKNTFARYHGKAAGSLPHGEHARRNVGLSILREGREINMSQALSAPSEPRERWFHVEVDLPQELDGILGMTNNKQEYTRLEQVLKEDQAEYLQAGETTQQCLARISKEDDALAICLRIAWKTQDIWSKTRQTHMGMREEVVGKTKPQPGDKPPQESPEDEAEGAASKADPPKAGKGKGLKDELRDQLTKKGVPDAQAEQMAARVVERGLSYLIADSGGLGSPFFTVTDVKGVKFLQLNSDHAMFKFLKSTIDDVGSSDADELRRRLGDAKLAVLLLLEGWGKIEVAAVPDEKKRLGRHREDWGRVVTEFIEKLQEAREEEGEEPAEEESED